MTWPPDIADDLPAPRDDEPASLRQDIADELADHLQSSFTRELHSTPEETIAKQSVLDRFGDPRRIARQLWLDALKEKIMSQRLNLVLSSLMTVACLGALALMGIMLRDSRQATQSLLEQNQAANAALLEKLAALATRPAAPAPVAEPAKSMEWNSVKIRLVKDNAGGAPAQGFTVALQGFLLDTAKEIEINRTTDTNGIADLGLVRPGQHQLKVWTTWKERRQEELLTVLPGQSIDDEIVCPGSEREETSASITVDWPDELRDKKLWLIAHLSQKGRDVAGKNWSGPSNLRDRLAIVDDTGAAASLTMDENWAAAQPFRRGPFDLSGMAGFPNNNRYGAFIDPSMQDRLQRGRGRGRTGADDVGSNLPGTSPLALRPYHFKFPADQVASAGGWPVGQYILTDLLIAEKSSNPETENVRTLDVLGAFITGHAGTPIADQFRQSGFNGQLVFPTITDWVAADPRESRASRDLQLSQLRDKLQPVVELNPKIVNQLKIPVPQRLAENVSKFLKAAE